MTSLADFSYRHSYRLRVILPVMLFAMFPSTRAQIYSLLVITAADSTTAAPPTRRRRHRHHLFMVGSTPCLDIAMLLMGIGMVSAGPHHGYGGPPSRSQWSTMAMADMKHGYGGNLHRGAAVHHENMAMGWDLHRGRSGPP